MDDLLSIVKYWLQHDQLTTREITERVAIDQFLWDQPPEERKAVELKGP